jgi:hypothetical protein
MKYLINRLMNNSRVQRFLNGLTHGLLWRNNSNITWVNVTDNGRDGEFKLSRVYIYIYNYYVGLVMVFNATFNNISVISLQSFLLMEEIRVPGENHRAAASH